MYEHGEWSTRKGSVLTLRDAVEMATVIGWAQRNAKLTWLTEHGDLLVGTARSIGDENGNFLRADDDVRDAFFRITTVNGFEVFMPMVDVVSLVHKFEMVEQSR